MSEEKSAGTGETGKKPSPLREIVQPFIDLVHAPRALWGINVSYFLEGLIYFGMLNYLVMYFNEYVGLTDQLAGMMVGVLTYGITFSMFLFGGLSDKWGVRFSILASLVLMMAGRIFLAQGPFSLPAGGGMWSPLFFAAIVGILLIVIGYGAYQPAAYAAVRKFTTPATAGMGYAMLYALMNLGGWLPSFFGPIRQAVGMAGAYWLYVGLTAMGIILTALILTRKTVANAVAAAKAAGGGEGEVKAEDKRAPGQGKEPFSVVRWLKNHPLADAKFAFFIFCLIPVQTLFAHNWLTLPVYVSRAYQGTWLGDNFEAATNFNPLLIFVLVPIVTAITEKRNVYSMMIAGTFVMAVPTFLLALGPSFMTLLTYLVINAIGEAMWQPRFLQYAAEIAPPGRTGAYMGIAQFPWFLTKVVTSLYSGWFLAHYCPAEGALDTETMWIIYGAIAMSSTVMLVLAKGWLGKDFKTKA